MKVLIAPDSFKGSLGSEEFSHAVMQQWSAARPDDQLFEFPLADGGEGTSGVIGRFLGARKIDVDTVDPLGRAMTASFQLYEKTAIIDFASASGLTLLSPQERAPDITSSYGTGLMIKSAMEHGASHILMGLGGSATNDAALGLIEALGGRFLDAENHPIPRGGMGLGQLRKILLDDLDPRLAETEITLLTDVTNPLTGDNGATHIFGPQKCAPEGNHKALLAALESAMVNTENVLAMHSDSDVDQLVGAGAAGGAGATLQVLLQAEYRGGIQYVLDLYQFESELSDTDLVITGEGRLDEQSLQGKVVSGVLDVTSRYNVPTIALVGSMSAELNEHFRRGLSAAYSISNVPMTLSEAQIHAKENLQQLVTNLARTFNIFTR